MFADIYMHVVLCALWMLRLQWRYYLFLPPIIWSFFGSLAKSCITTVSSSSAVIMNGISILFVPAQHKVLKKIFLVWWMYYDVVVLCVCFETCRQTGFCVWIGWKLCIQLNQLSCESAKEKTLTVSVFLIAAGSAVLHDGRDFHMKNVLDRNIYLIYFNWIPW